MSHGDPSDDERPVQWFVLQAQDTHLRHPTAETRFEVKDLDALRLILGDDASDDAELRNVYELEERDLDAILATFGVGFEAGLRPVSLVPWHSSRAAPYLNHSGFELPLMLEGRKPFAKFSGVEPCEWLDEILAPFEPFVAEGRLVRRIERRTHTRGTDATRYRIREIYFALPGQEWRIDAYLLLVEVGYRSGWNDAYERYEGRLLGYEDWQNDWHIERRRREGLEFHSERLRCDE
jgi:hypothetical protein